MSIRPEPRLAAILAAVAALLLAAPAFPGTVEVALALDGLIVVAALVDLALAVPPRELDVDRRAAEKLSLGEENLVRLRVRSRAGHAARLSIRDDPPPEIPGRPAWQPLAVAARGEAEASYHVSPVRRGDYRFGDVHVRSHGPLGLLRAERAVPAARAVRVLPNLLGIERWKLALRRSRLAEMGLHVIRKRGSGTEFEKLRPYAVGDEFRHLDWKATARRRSPVTRVFETERSQTVLVGIDVGRQMSTWVAGLSRLDYAINAALMLAYVAGSRDDKVGLAVFADELERWLEPKKGARQYRRFMEALYPLEAEAVYTDFVGAFQKVAARQRRRSLVVIFTDIVDPDALKDLARGLAILRRTHLPLVVALRDPSFAALAGGAPHGAQGVYEKVVARELLEERTRAIRELQRAGAHVIDVLPHDFSAGVVGKYLDLKARGLL